MKNVLILAFFTLSPLCNAMAPGDMSNVIRSNSSAPGESTGSLNSQELNIHQWDPKPAETKDEEIARLKRENARLQLRVKQLESREKSNQSLITHLLENQGNNQPRSSALAAQPELIRSSHDNHED